MSGRSADIATHERDRHLRADPHAGLRTFHAALADSANTPVDIFFKGDSITEGAGASALNKRFVSLVRDALRSAYQPAGITGGEGYSPAFTYYNNPWTYSGSYTQPSTNGLGMLGVTLAASGSATRTFTGTALDVFTAKVAGGGTLTVSVDGAVSGTGFATIATVNATQVNGFVTRVGGLTAGTHTVTVAASGGSVVFEGVMIYNGDEAKGIRVWTSAHSGYPSSAYVSNTSWLGAVTAIQPDLIIVMLGTNDFRTSAGNTWTNMRNNIRTVLNAARGICSLPPSALMIAPYESTKVGGTNTVGGGMQQFVDEILQAAYVDGNAKSLNLYARSGGAAFQGQQMGLLAADNIHPSDKGHQWIAGQVMSAIRI